ncbi:MAG: transposase family protein [Abitibacteriaceae bacterium]|nr:transposase family protein [Abditibacteriaceae bacterium]MBV9867558.1 transposase family protein [Abditibacteriaceae bacterium]
MTKSTRCNRGEDEVEASNALTVAQAAHQLKTTQRMIRHWLATGKLKVVLSADGQRQGIDPQAVAALQESSRRGGQAGDATPPRAATSQSLTSLKVLASCQPLIEVLDGIQDFRRSRGRRYALSSILALACAAMLCGCHTYSSIALWGRYYGGELLQELGFNRARIPCELTFYMVFSGLNRTEFENRLAPWVSSIIEVLQARPEQPVKKSTTAAINQSLAEARPLFEAQAQDKSAEEVMGSNLLTSLSHCLGLPQSRINPNLEDEELPVLSRMIEGLVLEGKVMVADGVG